MTDTSLTDSSSQAFEVEDDVYYDPDATGNVVALEPPIMVEGRRRAKNEMREMPDKPSDG